MRRSISLAVCFVALVGLMNMGVGEEPSEKAKGHAEPSFFMRKKLQYSEQVLAGLATEDFEQIRQAAKAMNALSQIEKWVHANRPGYRTQLAVFHDANQQLIDQADEEDLDGATLAYVQLTLSCVNCHKIVRDTVQVKSKP